MRVFIDSNILISAILFPESKVAHVFSYLLENHHLIISSYGLKECERVFEMKFPAKIQCFKDFISALSFELFKTPEKIDPKNFPQIRDAKDLPILASAILSDADVLITGDKDFEDLSINKPLILTANRYFELITQEQ